MIPSMLLQTLLENAVKHGVSQERGPGRIDVIVRTTSDQIVIEVRNTGPAPSTRGRAEFDGCGMPGDPKDRNDQTLAGARFSSSSQLTRDWVTRFTAGQGRDHLEVRGAFPSRFETRQNQFSWINDVAIPGEGTLAFYLARAYWGRGLATEAGRAFVRHGFDGLRLGRIVAGANSR